MGCLMDCSIDGIAVAVSYGLSVRLLCFGLTANVGVAVAVDVCMSTMVVVLVGGN